MAYNASRFAQRHMLLRQASARNLNALQEAQARPGRLTMAQLQRLAGPATASRLAGGSSPLGGGGNPLAGGGGYSGLQGVIQALSGGINAQQLQRMQEGYTGANGAIGGMKGSMQGLSPYAVHFLATSGLLQQNAPQLQDTTGLSGDDLFRANLMNTLAQQAPATYSLHSGVDANFLQQVLGQIGNPAFAKGFNAGGRIPRPLPGGRSPMPPMPTGGILPPQPLAS